MGLKRHRIADIEAYCEKHITLAPELPSGLRWRIAPAIGLSHLVGQMAGTKTAKGYYRVSLMGRKYMTHQIVYAINHGFELVASVRKDRKLSFDHIDRNKANNSAVNLRVADWTTQQMNRCLP
ncbi:hypothetical protein ACUNHT_24775 [Serratia sp. IR-2025]|uniref:hypothetical protein n=1 Tax=Serratia marcescens TaxID=615 RepID=UPI001A1EE204|nr:hypothetical protein [Serratia marcescens]MDP8641328.1 hypothetical protein [Serratia marcescens]MDP8834930.1 hypothetical protein [Serratia marcescens]HAT2853026.1 hypothetical protein [Serratia marcescens]